MSNEPEFSRVHAADQLPAAGMPFAVEASPAECRELARRFELPALHRLRAWGRMGPLPGTELVEVAGELEAAVEQRCVVTLEPVPATVRAGFRRLFGGEPEAEAELEIDAERDLPEPMPEGGLDLGEIVAEELSLALDPYPRSPDADRVLAEAARDAGEAASGPFAALAAKRVH